MLPGRGHLAFVGMTTIDIVQVAGELPELNRKGWAHDAYLDVGGPAANAAITAAILGSPVSLHSTFGAGPLGELAIDLIDQHGVTRVGYGDDQAVPVSSIWVSEASGDRTLLSTASSFGGPKPDRVDLDGAKAILLDGFYPDLARAAARVASERGIPVALDCGSWRDVFDDLLPQASVAILAEQFQLPGNPGASPEDVMASLLDEYRVQFVAVSRGGDPIVWASQEAGGRLAVPQVTAVDTLGAGDVLHGALMHYAYQQHLDLGAALEKAAAVAARSCEYFGARAGVEAWVASGKANG